VAGTAPVGLICSDGGGGGQSRQNRYTAGNTSWQVTDSLANAESIGASRAADWEGMKNMRLMWLSLYFTVCLLAARLHTTGQLILLREESHHYGL